MPAHHLLYIEICVLIQINLRSIPLGWQPLKKLISIFTIQGQLSYAGKKQNISLLYYFLGFAVTWLIYLRTELAAVL